MGTNFSSNLIGSKRLRQLSRRAAQALLSGLLLCNLMLFSNDSSCNAGIIREFITPPVVSDEYNAIEELVRHYYPKAKFTRTPNGLHFAYKTKPEVGYYSDKIVLAPLDGGILGELVLTPGKCQEMETTVADGFHSTLTLGPYSQNLKAHLLVKLTYPANDFSPDFEDRFIDLVDRFGAMDDAIDRTSSPSEVTPQNASKHQENNANPAS